MAERILRSPGVSTRELDLSAPGRIRPQGIPAGVIGTAQKGPAFVPVTFATANDFANLFGASEGKYFGAMAVNEWMRNAKSGLFIRTLGVGDGKKADSSNVTTNAGFQVGSKMRNKDSGSTETDGSADGLAINPYAGAAIPDVVTSVKTHTAGIVAAEAVITLTLGTWASNAALDGQYFIVQVPTAANNATMLKTLFWISAQATDQANTPGVRTITGLKIQDGSIETDLTATGVDQIKFIDLTDFDGSDTPVTNAATFQDAIVYWTAHGKSAAKITSAEDGANVALTAQNVGAAIAPTKSAAIITAIAEAGGVTLQTHVNYSNVLTFEEEILISAGTTIVINDGEASPEEVTLTFTTAAEKGSAVGAAPEFDLGALTTPETLLNAVFNYLTGTSGTNLAHGGVAENVQQISSSVMASQHLSVAATPINTSTTGNQLSLTISQTASGTTADPTKTPVVTVTENSPNAPLGRTYFLGCDMKVSANTQDYLSADSATYKKILRGVLMFPSGVLPGLETIGGGAITSAAMPAAAYGTYDTGKDQGAETGNVSISGLFKFVLNGFSNTANYNAHLTGSFDPLSPIYFPKVLNTDPTKIQERGHYLYAHYDVPVGLASHRVDGGDYAYMLPGAHDHNDGDYAATSNHYKPTFENWKQKFSHAFTPWILSQTLGSAPKKLFKFHMLDAGSAGHGQVKVSIANISKSTDVKSAYGSFDVQIRSANDSDLQPIILQSFSGLNLNPSSDRYIARVIGDQNTFFEFEKNEGKQKLVTEGLYPNKSQYVRIEVNDQIEAGMMEASALPVGFAGKNHLVINGESLSDGVDLIEPPVPYRQSVSIGTGATKTVDPRFYWGTQYQDIQSETERNRNTGMLSLISNLTKHFPSIGEYPAWVGDNRNAVQGSGLADLDADAYNKNYFSLEKVLIRTKLTSAGLADTSNPVDPRFWHEALYIRDGNTAFANADGSTVYNSVVNGPANDKHKDADNGYRYLNVAKDFASSASKRYYKFTVPMQGGFDGLDIFDKDKSDMANLSAFREMSTNTSSVLGGSDGPTTASFRKAIDILAEKSDVDIQLLVIPGMRDAGISEYAIDKTEERFDALYIMDMPAYDHDSNLITKSTQETSVTNTSSTLADRNIDSSFVATYFPDVVLQDGEINVVAPSSVAVLGAMSLNDSVAHPWYAPAGFARGALPTAIEPAVYLNRPNMDVLYDTDINPITTFPNSGNSVVIFGQKTMLQAQSALDRVNVRRLLIDVRRKVRNVANTILFEPNRESTLARFSALVNPILGRIQQQQGLDRYKVVIDTTTTTQQDVENNTIRGKIFLQPTRSIEFISLDFVVTNAGAEI
jgi:hypothetical protein